SQKTEQATPRKLQKARREGQFVSARHFVSGMQFLAFVAIIVNWGGQWRNESGLARDGDGGLSDKHGQLRSAATLLRTSAPGAVPAGGGRLDPGAGDP